MRAQLALAALLLTVACGEKLPDATVDGTVPPPAAPNSASGSDVDRAVEMSNALSAHPTKGDSILAAQGMTAEQLETLMLKIAKDSAASAEYGRRTTR
jgi:hypothetical protein